MPGAASGASGTVVAGWALSLCAGARVARLATIAPGGAPHLVPVCYALAGGEVFVPVDQKPKRGTDLARLRNIRRDPRATLLVDHYDDSDWTSLAWVRLECEAGVVSPGSERQDALAALREKYRQYRAMALEDRPLIVLRVQRVVAWRWSDAPGAVS